MIMEEGKEVAYEQAKKAQNKVVRSRLPSLPSSEDFKRNLQDFKRRLSNTKIVDAFTNNVLNENKPLRVAQN